MSSPMGYYILVKPKKLYHVYNINKYEKCGDDENEYNSMPICDTANAYLEGTINNPQIVKIDDIKNIIIDIYIITTIIFVVNALMKYLWKAVLNY